MFKGFSCRVSGLGFRVEDLDFRVLGLGSLGFRVEIR